MAEVVGFAILVFVIGPIVVDVVYGLGLLIAKPFDPGPKKKRTATEKPIRTR